MPIQYIKRDIKKHRPIDWFAIIVLISAAFVIGSILFDKVEKFSQEMEKEAERLRAEIIHIKTLRK